MLPRGIFGGFLNFSQNFLAVGVEEDDLGTSVRLSMGTSDEIEDATITIDKTKVSEIEATKRRFRQYISQSDLRKLNMKIISHLIHNKS